MRKKCRCCSLVGKVTSRPELKDLSIKDLQHIEWKRLFLFVVPLILILFSLFILIGSIGQEQGWVVWVFAVPLLLVCVLMFIVSIIGCDKCIIRLYGNGGGGGIVLP